MKNVFEDIKILPPSLPTPTVEVLTVSKQTGCSGSLFAVTYKETVHGKLI